MRRIISGIMAVLLICSNLSISVMAMPAENEIPVSVSGNEATVSGNEATVSGSEVSMSGNDASVSENDISVNEDVVVEDAVKSTTETFLVDTDAPYDGDFVLIANTGTNLNTGYESTGTLPNVEQNLSGELSAYGEYAEDSLYARLGSGIMGIDKYGYGLKDTSHLLDFPGEPLNSPDVNTNRVYEAEEPAEYSVGDEKILYLAYDSLDYEDSYYPIECVCAAVGTYSTVWIPKDDPIYVANETKMKNYMQDIADEFDSKFPKMSDMFGSKEAADLTGDKDGKTAILCYDIEGDGTRGNGSDSYVGGYFYMRDLDLPDIYNAYETGNRIDCIHIDSYMGMQRNESTQTLDISNIYGTLVHELQHMINYSICRTAEDSFLQLDTPDYLNEAFSEAASHLCYGPSEGKGRINTYNNSSNIVIGSASLLNWGGGNVLDNYALSYLFSQYIRTQYKNDDTIYKDSMNELSSENPVLLEIIADKLEISSDELLLNFRAALFLKNADGKYGFKGEEWAENIRSNYANKGTATSTQLLPGAAIVLSSTGGFVPSGNGENIDFIGMNTEMTTEDVTVRISGGNSISTHGGTLQLQASVSPEYVGQGVIFTLPNAADKKFAMVTTEGLVTAIGNGSVTVRATSVFSPSKYAEATIIITGQSNVEGEVTVTDITGAKKVTCATSNAENVEMYYTTDGTVPTDESQVFPTEGLVISKKGTTQVTILLEDTTKALNPGYLECEVVLEQKEIPEITVVTAESGRTTHSITFDIADGAVVYTTDGSEPVVGVSQEYTAESGPIVLDELGEYKVKYMATELGKINSEIEEKELHVRDRFESITFSASEMLLYTNVENQHKGNRMSYTFAPQTANSKGIEWSSSNESVATVDKDGYVTALVAGETTITASADGVSNSYTVYVHTKADELLLNNSNLSITKDLGTLQLVPYTEPYDATNKEYTYLIEPSDREEDAKGLAYVSETGLITAAKNGVVKVTVKNNNLLGTTDTFVENSFYVTISNQKSFEKEYCPRFTTESFTISKLETRGKEFNIIPLYEHSVYGAGIKEDYEYANCFSLVKAEGEFAWAIALTEEGKSQLQNKKYTVPVVVSTNENFVKNITVKVNSSKPSVSLSKISLNTVYPKQTYALVVKSKSGDVTVTDISDSVKNPGFTENFTFDYENQIITMAKPYADFTKNSKNKPVMEGIATVQVDGYEPQEIAIKVALKNKAPKLETELKSYNMNYTKLSDDGFLIVGIKNVISSKVKEDLTTISDVRLNEAGGSNYNKVKDIVEVSPDNDGVRIDFIGETLVAGTYTIPLLISSSNEEYPENDFTDVKCNVKVVIKKETQLPKLTLKTKSVKLNKKLVGEVATIAIKSIDQNNANLIGFDIEPAEAKSTSNVDEAVDLYYNEATGCLEAMQTDDMPGCNKYVFKCTPIYEGINEDGEVAITPISVTVNLIDKTSTVSVSAKGSIDAINRENSEITYTIKKSNFVDSVSAVEMIEPLKTSSTILDAREYFEDPVLNENGTISVKAKEDVVLTKKRQYAFRFAMTLENTGETVITKDIKITPKQSSIKLSADASPVFYNRVSKAYNEVPITLETNKGKIARVEYVVTDNKKVPAAFGVELTGDGQLQAISFDGSQNVKKATYTLTLCVYYEDQMWEAPTSKTVSYEKPVKYKIKVTVK